ncbi:DUF6455 family protein [Salipiger aestuarii]|uniref:DUF6455 family protein n=1 Tax=Salipiger aestuarii TaxID=568098 RepID=UPI001CC32352|nr:DUF6455 family protein [Salipiger aestuarii]
MPDRRPKQTPRRPRPLGDRTDHYWRVLRMARANGTDLVAALDQGHLTSDDWAGMVQRCRGCAWADGCRRWLDDPEQALRDTPHDCVNRAHFASLRNRLQE